MMARRTGECGCSCHEMIETMPGVFHPAGVHYTKDGKCYCEENAEDVKMRRGEIEWKI